MMHKRQHALSVRLKTLCPDNRVDYHTNMPVLYGEVDSLESIMQHLQAHDDLQMNMLLDLCVVDRLHYGVDEWVGVQGTSQGYDRARTPLDQQALIQEKGRFEVVYHLLSTTHNHRARVKVSLNDASTLVPSMTGIWPNANWYEREAFDLFGIRFINHPDLRRILTDYGFVGYPMRKDFPLQGRVELRYDASLARCLYEPVTLENRVSTPKVIRRDDDRLSITE